MAKDVKRRFTVDLEISMGDAEKKIKGTVGNIKAILADLGKASDKMSYFKELAEYLSQVDSELDRFKKKHGDGLFDQIFGGLDASLRKEMEDVFKTAQTQLTQLETIRSKFEKMKTDGATVEELKPLEQELKDLYNSIGRLDDAKISGRGSLETRLQKMEDSLNNFAIVWDGVNDKIAKGFQFGGHGGSVGGKSPADDIEHFSAEVQEQIDKLNKQIKELEEAKAKFQQVSKIVNNVKSKGDKAIPASYTPDLTVDSVQKLIDEFDLLKGVLETSDKSSVDYYNNLTRIIEVTFALKKALSGVRADDALKQAFTDVWTGADGHLLSKLSMYASSKSSSIFKNFFDISDIKNIDTAIASLYSQIERLKGSAPGGLSDDVLDLDVGQVKKRIDELEKQLRRYEAIILAFQDVADEKAGFDADGELDVFDIEKSVQSIQQLVSDYKLAAKAKKDFESAGNVSSADYYENLAKMSKLVLQLQYVEQTMDDNLENALSNKKIGKGTLLGSFETIAEEIQGFFENIFYSASGTIDKLIDESKSEIQSLQHMLENVETPGKTSSSKTKTGAGGSGSGTGTPVTNIDFTDLKDTIKTEISALSAKLDDVLKVELVKDDTKDIQSTIESIRSTVEEISGAIDTYNSIQKTSEKQAEINVMKNNLTQLLKYVSDFNARKIDGEYQGQELSASLLSDGTISVGYGEKGSVPWDRVASNLVNNLANSFIMDMHSHPLHTVLNGSDAYVSDAFSGSSGDLAAFNVSKRLGAKIAAMITGNVLRTIDLTKLDDSQMSSFRKELANTEKQYAQNPKYSSYIGQNGSDGLFYYRQDTQAGQHKVTQIFESIMYDAFSKIGLSKDFVDNNVFRKYDLTNDQQLTEIAEKLIQLSSSAQTALSPVQRLTEIISAFHGDTISSDAQTAFRAFEKGELSAVDVFNKLNNHGYTINQDTLDSLYKIDTANEISAVESLLTQVTSVLDAINANVASIENNTRRSTSDRLDATMNDIIDLRNGIDSGRLTAGVKSIYDPLNISEFKSQEVLRQADESVLNFTDVFHDIYDRSLRDEHVDVDVLQDILNRFITAMSHVKDAQKQIDLYESRTGKTVYDNGEFATDSLLEKYHELIDSSNLSDLLYMLSQAKWDIHDDKMNYSDGLPTSMHQDMNDNDLIVSGLQGLQATLDSIYGVLHGFTGIEADTKKSVKYTQPSVDNAVNSREFSEADLSILNSILQAIQDIGNYLRTNKYDNTNEQNIVDDANINNLILAIKSAFSQQSTDESILQAIKTVIDNIYAHLVQAQIKPDSDDENNDKSQESSIYQLLASKLPANIASEDTLSAIRDMVGQLIEVVKSKDDNQQDDENEKIQTSLNQLVVSLMSAVQGLQDVTNGIVKDQKARKSDTSVANARIANKEEYAQIRDIALNSLGDRALDSEVTEMKALANGIVQVIGYLQVAENEWEGFTVQINEANEASKLAFDKNSKAAKRAAAAAEALRKTGSGGTADDNPLKYDRANVEARAKVHLDEYTAQGKNATVQFKDSGRYTISILEEIGGLSRQIFQTFDENDEKIERTTATMSNKVLVKLQSLQKLADFGRSNGFINDSDDSYKKYNDAYVELERLNALYKDQDNLTDEDIASWNTQIKLVQQLGAEIEKIILKRKTAASSGLFNSQRNVQVSTFDKDYEQLKQSIAIPDSFTSRINDVRDALKNAVDNDSLQIARNNWTALRKEIEKTALEQDLYIKKEKTAGTTKKSTYGTTAVVNAQAQFNKLKKSAQPYLEDGSVVVSKAMKKYKEAYDKLIELQEEFKNKQNLTDAQKSQFKRLKDDCIQYGNELKKIIDSSDKLESSGTHYKRIVDDTPLEEAKDRANALREYVQEAFQSRAKIQGLNGDATKLNFTLKHGDGTIEKMTASLNAARTAIVSVSQGTQKTTSIFSSLTSKFKELWVYAASRFGVDEIIQGIRTGIQYVREIDSALTELKKVTNETDMAYDRFLQNMSKTAGVVGSTVSELTTMAAEWSRLGYSMEESAQLAENTAILLNVSEFESATEASEALISTMQAFGYAAEDSRHVVDILNEVGKFIARR